jgi:hypothetical protein
VKKCSYCGKEYPDDAQVCAIDLTPLESTDPIPREVADSTSSGDNSARLRQELEFDREVADVLEPPPNRAPGDETNSEPDEFREIATLSGHEAGLLLDQLTEAGLRFEIDRVERIIKSPARDRKVDYIRVYVHRDDYDKAFKIYSADWQV